MLKTIIHARIPTNEYGMPTISLENVGKIIKNMREMLGKEDYTVIASPFETNKIDGGKPFIIIDCKTYSYNELMEVIEKASMYDGLCK